MTKFVFSFLIITLLTVFILQNALVVTIHLAWWQMQVHLILLLLLLFVAGVFTGWWLGRKGKVEKKHKSIVNEEPDVR